jgi:hypothetical protein
VLKSAYLVYYKFWGSNLDDILDPVGPDCGKLKYFSQNQIGRLNLKPLRYLKEALLVRDEYEVVYEDLCSYKDKARLRGGGVVVTGQPGIGMLLLPTLASITHNLHPTPNPGKTCFLYYLLFRLLSKKKTVAFQLDDVFVLFQDTGVSLSDNTSALEKIPGGTWALTDSRANPERPYPAFLTGDAWVVQTTSPSPGKWQSRNKELKAVTYWMDVFSLDEMVALG